MAVGRREWTGNDLGTASLRSARTRTRPVLVRTRLLDLIDLARPVTVLRAPSGFGKSTLVADWAHRRVGEDTLRVWLRLPESREATSAWGALAEALHDAGLGGPLREPASFARIARAVDAASSPVVLIVDELENVTDPRFDLDLLELVRDAPMLRLVACVRSPERLPAHQILHLGSTTIDAADLVLTDAEARELAAVIDPRLSAEVVDAVRGDCGGWPALIAAVLHALADDPHRPTPEQVKNRVERIAVDYVWGRLLPPSIPAEQREFALLTSLPQSFTVELVEELADGAPAALYVDELVARGLLHARIRDGERIFEWPAAVRRVLIAELNHRRAARLPALHAILARSYAGQGRAGDAVHHAVRSGDWALVVDILDAHWRILLVQHRTEFVEAINATPLRYVRQRRRAAAMRDVVLQLPVEQMLTIDTLPRSPEALDELGRAEDVAERLDTELAVLVALRNCAAIDDARDFAVRLLRLARAARQAQPALVASLYPSVLSQVGVTFMYASDLRGAIEPTRVAYHAAGDSPYDYLARETSSKLALIHAFDGDQWRAGVWLARHDAAPHATSWLATFIDPVPEMARLLLALDRLDLTAATAAAQQLIRHRHPERAWTWQVYARAMLALHTGTATDALQLLDEARSTRLRWHEPQLIGRPLLDAAEADLLMSLGRARQAHEVLHGAHARHPLLRVGQARLALLGGDPEKALNLTRDPAWERKATIRQRHETLIMRAVAAHRLGDVATATQALQRAANTSAASGVLRPFTTVPRAELSELFDRVPLVREQLSAPPLASHPDLFPPSLAMVTLSPREQLVLEKLAAGLSLRQAAAALVVSYNTIRTQQASIYRKLGVSSRPEAVAQAREWGLL